MSVNTLIVLPNRDEMARRLTDVSSETVRVKYLYPHLLATAGRELSGAGVVIVLQQAIANCIANISPVLQNATVRVARAMQTDVDDYLRALIDDDEARAEALALMEELRR